MRCQIFSHLALETAEKIHFGYPACVLRSTAVRSFNITRCLHLRPNNSDPHVLLVIRADHARVLAITKEFVCLALIIKKWEAIEVRTAAGG